MSKSCSNCYFCVRSVFTGAFTCCERNGLKLTPVNADSFCDKWQSQSEYQPQQGWIE